MTPLFELYKLRRETIDKEFDFLPGTEMIGNLGSFAAHNSEAR